MRPRLWIPFLLATMACGASPSEEPAPAIEPPNDAGAGPVDAGVPDVVATPDAAPPEVDMAAALLAKLGTCTAVSKSPFATDNGKTANVDVCGMKNAVYWQADMDIDCDGKESPVCSKATDPSFQNQTAMTDSKGGPLDAATVPFVVVPQPSNRWDYRASDLALGTVVAVIYDGKIEYGIIGDTGPTAIIGEASYAMAKSLGINPDPRIGGIGSGVTYVAFTGKDDAVTKNEDHAEAVTIGKRRAAQFLDEN
ncbi:MAG: hypothetical protein BGO98_25255 [Myxococcales bacterium 68-20]|nr:glycoside hydrolase family 75 protein [Myxococcales bacterium]OJY15960.1 MAG: hypothetical protein BGO98_25255 [Myxococcales bacterium 68-20]